MNLRYLYSFKLTNSLAFAFNTSPSPRSVSPPPLEYNVADEMGEGSTFRVPTEKKFLKIFKLFFLNYKIL